VEIVFWLLVFLIFYGYFGYPLLLRIWAKLRSKPVRKSPCTPMVSVVMSVCDEEDVMEKKINNLLNLNYPPEKIEILIGSDGSQDQTNEIIKRIQNPQIRLFEYPTRKGKISILNQLVPAALGEIVVFTDARQILDPLAIHELVSNFFDPLVGSVSGELIFAGSQEGTGQGIRLYWRYEKFIRRLESQIHSILGATGALYAIRRELYPIAPENVILDDMYIPLKIIQRGYRAVFEARAQVFDQVAEDPQEEYSRKVRTLYGNFQLFMLLPEMLLLWKSPIAIQLLSHKLLRVLIPFFLIALSGINFFLLSLFFYKRVLILQMIFYTMAMVGYWARHPKNAWLKVISRLCYIPYVFCLLNYSALIGFVRFIGARQAVAWQKARLAEQE